MTAASDPAVARAAGRAIARPASRDAAGLALLVATILTGLVAGVWFAYATSVMLALHRVDDRTFVDVMQQVNDVIQNPVFLAGFFGAFVLAAVAAVLERRAGRRDAARWVVAALVLYLVGALVVTMAANVPLNDELARAGDPDRIADLAAVRDRFEDPWNTWTSFAAWRRRVAGLPRLGALVRERGRRERSG
jgi:uncharacterized membrane protein